MIPVTTRFAQKAAALLREGKTSEALAVCDEGTKHFPWYATGYLYLGKSYEALGRDAEAVLEYRKAWLLIPDSEVLIEHVNRVTAKVDGSFEEFAAGKMTELEPKRNSRTFGSFLSGPPRVEESQVETLMKQLQGVKRIVPAADEVPPVPAPEVPPNGPKIVTPTLAEIYASQGQYAEAAAAYRRLAEERPLESERYLERAMELEALARSGM